MSTYVFHRVISRYRFSMCFISGIFEDRRHHRDSLERLRSSSLWRAVGVYRTVLFITSLNNDPPPKSCSDVAHCSKHSMLWIEAAQRSPTVPFPSESQLIRVVCCSSLGRTSNGAIGCYTEYPCLHGISPINVFECRNRFRVANLLLFFSSYWTRNYSFSKWQNQYPKQYERRHHMDVSSWGDYQKLERHLIVVLHFCYTTTRFTEHQRSRPSPSTTAYDQLSRTANTLNHPCCEVPLTFKISFNFAERIQRVESLWIISGLPSNCSKKKIVIKI